MSIKRGVILPQPPAAEASRSSPAILVCAVLGGIFIAARPLAGQFAQYSAENAFAGLATILFALAAAALALAKNDFRMPRSLCFFALLWFGVFLWGACRSPYMGAAVPLATEIALYMVVLLCGYAAGKAEPSLRGIFIRVIIAMAAVEAFFAIWQIYVDLPRMRHQVDTGEVALTDDLKSKIGLDRFYGENAFGTFVNPNSLAGFLIVGFLLLLGHTWDSFAKLWSKATAAVAAPHRSTSIVYVSVKAINLFLLVLMLAALYWTGSKGGALALLFGIWFFALQRLNTRFPVLNKLTVLGIAALVVVLVLGLSGVIPSRLFGLSLQVRFEYWKSALAMFAQHPLDGVGLGGFSEWQPFFKTKLGWETKDPHNDYIWLLAELGVLGPMIYLAIWWLILKRCKTPVTAFATHERSEPSPFPSPLGGEGRRERSERGVRGAAASLTALMDAKDSRLVELLAIVGGAFALLFAIAQFRVFNAGDVANWLNGDTSRQTSAASLQTLFMPILFAVTAVILRADAMSSRTAGVPRASEQSEPSPFPSPLGGEGRREQSERGVRGGAASIRRASHDDSPALMHGFRAAAGAVLIHQLVDFDFKAQAIMAALFLCGGLFWGSADTTSEQSQNQSSRAQNAPAFFNWLLPVCALLLLPTAVWLQYNSGAPRAEAEFHEELFKQLNEHPEKAEPGETLEQHRSSIVYQRQLAARAAPFDSEAWTELGIAKAAHNAQSAQTDAEILEIFEKAAALRPLNAKPKVLLGSFYLRRGLEFKRMSLDPRADFKRSEAYFAVAAGRYPLHPGLRLMEGDAQLLSGEVAQASETYLRAFSIDIEINDPNVFLSGIFTDPRPGVASRHNSDHSILVELSGLLAKGEGVAKENTRSRMGLLVRRMTALARRLRDHEEQGVPDAETLAGIPVLKRNLRFTTEEIYESAQDLQERAHAALLLALCIKKTGPLEEGPAGTAQWNKDWAEAQETAKKLQRESQEKGTLGTQPQIFNSLIKP